MHNAFATMLQLPEISAWAMTVLFWFYQATPYALLGCFHGWMEKHRSGPDPLFCACALTLLVALRTVISPGTIHQSLACWPHLIQIADLGGRLLVFFVLVLGNWLLVEALAKRTQPPLSARYLAAFILLLATVLSYGFWRLDASHDQERQARQTEYVRVTALQPSFMPSPEGTNSDPSLIRDRVDSLISLQRKANQRFPSTDLTLWPEIPLELPCDCRAFERWGINSTVALSNASLLLACTELRTDKAKYNSAWAVRPEGKCRMVYRKLELVPFGEYTPLKKELQKLGLGGGTPRYIPGGKIRLLELPSGKRVQPLICYESGFPRLIRRGVELGADLLAVLTDDIWFASVRAEAMHLDMTLFRAVEFHRPLVNCTNSGISAHIKATGEIIPETLARSGVRTATYAALYCPQTRTAYARFGTNWLWFCVLWILFRLARSPWRNSAAH